MFIRSGGITAVNFPNVNLKTRQVGNNMKISVCFCLFIISFILGMVFDGLITRVPQEAHTVTQMSVVERELKAYAERYGGLPATIDELSRFSSRFDACLTNSWGHPISYTQMSASNAVLSTIGYGNVEFIKRVSLAEQADEQQ